jgi:hypothetical protein
MAMHNKADLVIDAGYDSACDKIGMQGTQVRCWKNRNIEAEMIGFGFEKMYRTRQYDQFTLK